MRSRRKQGRGNSGTKVRDADGKVCRDGTGHTVFAAPLPKLPSPWRAHQRKQSQDIAEAAWADARAEREAKRVAAMRSLGGY